MGVNAGELAFLNAGRLSKIEWAKSLGSTRNGHFTESTCEEIEFGKSLGDSFGMMEETNPLPFESEARRGRRTRPWFVR